MKGKSTLAVLVLAFVCMFALVGCGESTTATSETTTKEASKKEASSKETASEEKSSDKSSTKKEDSKETTKEASTKKDGSKETTKEASTKEGASSADSTATTEKKTAQKAESISDGTYTVENHYTIKLPDGKWTKAGKMSDGEIVFASNKGEEITVSYYKGKESKKQRKTFVTSEAKAKKKYVSKNEKLLDFDRTSLGGKDDAIVRMYYAKKSPKSDKRYTAVYLISGADATYIATGTTTSKKSSGYERLKECVKSLDLVYSFD